MKVALINEYFPPFAPGGGEWSTYYLAKNLSKKEVEVVVITPQLGGFREEMKDGFKIVRFPFYLKPKDEKNYPGNFGFTNPLWFFWAGFCYWYFLKKEKVDIIHVQGKYSIPPVILANKLLKKRVIATIRDYFCLCNYGMCLMKGEKACNLWNYYTYDFPVYLKTYVSNKNLQMILANLLYSIWGRVSTKWLKFFVNQVDGLTAMSHKQKEILELNGIKSKIKVIRNSFDFGSPPGKTSRQNMVLFVGRLTVGKGVRLIMDASKEVKKKYPGLRFVFAGQGVMLSDLREMARRSKNIELLGQVSHEQLEKYYKRAKVTLVPSVWPEPFARVPIESLSFGTPVVVTDSGGMSEYIKDGVYGYVSQKNSHDLALNIEKAIKNNHQLVRSINRDFMKIKKNFTDDVVNQHLQVYNLFAKTPLSQSGDSGEVRFQALKP